MRNNRNCGAAVAAKAFNVSDATDITTIQNSIEDAHFDRNNNGLQDLDLCMKGQTDDIQNNIVK